MRLDFIGYRDAKKAVMRWHYSKRMPQGRTVCVGVWEGSFIGAVVFSGGANKSLGSPLGLGLGECAELVRVALCSHESPVSQIVSRAVKMFCKLNAQTRGIASFADPVEGHVGTIYQAMNWRYLGQTAPGTQYLYDGKWLHNRSVAAMQFGARAKGKASALHAAGRLPVRKTPGKHRYWLGITRDVKRRCQAMALPYPKHAPEISTPLAPPEGGWCKTNPGALESS